MTAPALFLVVLLACGRLPATACTVHQATDIGGGPPAARTCPTDRRAYMAPEQRARPRGRVVRICGWHCE